MDTQGGYNSAVRSIVSFLASVLASAAVAAAQRPPKDPLAEARANPAKLTEKNYAELSDQNISSNGLAALSVAQNWRHAETDHFVIHFRRPTEAHRLARDAEFFYAKIKLDLAPWEDRKQGKSHIFLFDKDKLWEDFKPRVGIQPWAAAVAIGHELFFAAEPGGYDTIRRNSNTMAHELTHVIVNRFVPHRLPLWLNEGFAEFQEEDAYRKLKGQGVAPRGPPDPKQPSLAELVAMEKYPDDTEKLRLFYAAAHRLTRFLLTRHDKALFVPFLQEMMDGAPFEEAVQKIYSDKYKDFHAFERAFRFF